MNCLDLRPGKQHKRLPVVRGNDSKEGSAQRTARRSAREGEEVMPCMEDLDS